MSNQAGILKNIPKEKISAIELEGKSLPTAQRLGVLRNANEDTFSFNNRFTPDTEFTKRNVLKKTATIYDHLGFLAPYVVRTKLLIQQAVESKQQIEKIHYCSTRNNGSHGSKNPQV